MKFLPISASALSPGTSRLVSSSLSSSISINSGAGSRLSSLLPAAFKTWFGGMEVRSSESSSESESELSISTVAGFFPDTFAEARLGAIAAFGILVAVLAVSDNRSFFWVSDVVTLFFTTVPDFCRFRTSCGSPLVLALVDGLRLRGPEISGGIELVAMKVVVMLLLSECQDGLVES
jgi:hypothetical protein